MKYVGNVALFFVLLIYRAWVLVLGWGWFIVPLGAPQIGYAHALGLSVLVAMLAHQNTPDHNKGFSYLAIKATIEITLYLCFMWLYSLLM